MPTITRKMHFVAELDLVDSGCSVFPNNLQT